MGRVILPTWSPSIFCALNSRALHSFCKWPRAASVKGAHCLRLHGGVAMHLHTQGIRSWLCTYVYVCGYVNNFMSGYGL